jgi:hypothetical protein
MNGLHINVADLRQQSWRATELYSQFLRYAAMIGCHVEGDEIMATDQQGKRLAAWWSARTN